MDRIVTPGRIVIERLKKTCESHPAQWEGIASDGDWVYIRYRFGILSIGKGAERYEETDILSEQIGTELSGELSFEELKRALRSKFVLPECEDPTLEVPS